jgi:hypothetical protein
MGILDSIMTPVSQAEDPLAEREKWLARSQLFNSFTMNPQSSQGFYDSQQKGIDRQRESIALRSGNKLEAETLTRQSGMALKMLGDKFPMLSQALQAGIITPKEAVNASTNRGDVKVVGNSLVDSKGNVLFTYTDDSGGDTAALQTLKGRAVEAGLKEGTQAYQQFMLNAGKANGMSIVMGADGSFKLTQGGTGDLNLTEGQGKNYKFFIRGENANNIIGGLEQQGTSLKGYLAGKVPLGNIVQTQEYRQYTQARDAFIMSILRDESGAVIGTDEYWDADRRYMPQVGDDLATIAQKSKDRGLALQGLDVAAGGAVQAQASGSGSTGGSGSGIPSGVTVKKVGP